MKAPLLLIFIFLLSSISKAQELKSGFAEELVSSGLDQPTALTFAPDGRIFISEKEGSIRIVEKGQLLENPFLRLDVETASENGVQSVILDPDFEENYYVYVFYQPLNETRNRVSRFTANGNVAIPGSEVVLMTLDATEGNVHNGGAMQFGEDGKLYVATGDGSWSRNSQNLQNTLGKILRINKDGSIPHDNPLYDKLSGNNRAIYAYGLRNPYTMDINKETGRFFVNDVGLNSFEEINEIHAGKNYGWSEVEGFISNQSPPDNYLDPVFAYEHDHEGCAITGGSFYDSENKVFPEKLHNAYFYADFCKGYINALNPDNKEITDTLVKNTGSITNMAVNDDGSLYYMNFYEGKLKRIFYTGTGEAFFTRQPETILKSKDEAAVFTTQVAGEKPFTYQWYMNDISTGGDSAKLYLSDLSITDSNSTIYLDVTNSFGTVRSDTAYLNITSNSRPVPDIILPPDNILYSGGDTIYFKGTATDAEDGRLDKDHLSWKIDFHHDEHFHPGLPLTSGIDSGAYSVPVLGELSTNVWYRIHLTVKDKEGLTNTIYKDIHPRVVNINLNSEPEGLQLNVDGYIYSTPKKLAAVSGMKRVFEASEYYIQDDNIYIHQGWSGNEDKNTLQFFVPSKDTTITATYTLDQKLHTGNGQGLRGKYYNNSHWDGEPETTKVDSTIDFFWGWSEPETGISNNNFSVKWTGSVLAPVTGTYTFHLLYNEKAVVQFDGEEVIINMEEGADETHTDSFRVSLTGGEYYNIEINFSEGSRVSLCHLKWKYPSQKLTVIPKEYLYESMSEENGDETKELQVYPNPVKDHLIFMLENCTGRYPLSIFNNKGQLVYQATQDCAGLKSLNVKQLNTGIYHLKVKVGEKVYTTRFMKN